MSRSELSNFGASRSEAPLSRRWSVFVYQDGILLTTTLRGLDEAQVLAPSLDRERSVAELLPDIRRSGFGYLRVALRCLASQGWLEPSIGLDPEHTSLRWTDAGRLAARHHDLYVEVGRFLSLFRTLAPEAWSLHWNDEQTDAFLDIVELACDRWRLGSDLPDDLRSLITGHLDAGIVVPALLSLRGAGLLRADGPELPDTRAGRGVGDFFAALGWLDHATGKWAAAGRQAADFAVHLGMVASYLPALARLPELFRGTAVAISNDGAPEWHVHRGLNVVASAAAHRRYFDDADRIFLEIFNREPVEEQPTFVADMGCGDGSWLVHLNELITKRTLRGKRRDTSPVRMVGLDYSPAALGEARRVLAEAGIDALLLIGDISDPDAVASVLAEHGLRMEDGLHVRAFIDHNRTYLGGDEDLDVPGWSSGAYLAPGGNPLSGAEVERDLIAHMQRWSRHVRKHGMVVLEAHCVAPRVARQHLGATHSVAFDAYHGYSHQYPVEHSSLLRCCQLAGLQHETHSERRYPSSRPFVAVSANRFLAQTSEQLLPGAEQPHVRADSWRPDADLDLEDGVALHRLLYVQGDLRYPRLWCSAATGFVVARAIDAVEARLDGVQRGDVIRVLDYGAGTGLAAIEFLKACRQRNIEHRLEALGARLEVHLADLPSSWFAQGFELLSRCSWTRFHLLSKPDGGFRPLGEVAAGEQIDVAMANMVFHLIPGRALGRLAAELASVMRPGGELAWSSPDLGPAGPYALLFHDPNRALRRRWLELVDGRGAVVPGNATPERREGGDALREAVRRARACRDQAAIRRAQERADRRVLPAPNHGEDVNAAIAAEFRTASLVAQTHEILEEDIIDTLLVPSNQEEFLSEIPDRRLRERVVRELMTSEVLPRVREGPSGTAVGLNVHWTLGSATAWGGRHPR